MGLGVGKLYATNLGGMEETGSGQILLSERSPIQHYDDGEIWYSEPTKTSLGMTLFHVPNFLNIEPGDGSFEVVLEPCQEETGLYAIECDKEVLLFNYKPIEFSEAIGDIINVKYRKK